MCDLVKRLDVRKTSTNVEGQQSANKYLAAEHLASELTSVENRVEMWWLY